MRILAIQPFLRGQLLNPAAGGKNKVAYTLARRLSAQGHEVFLLPWKGERYADPVWVKLGGSGEQATALPTLFLTESASVFRVARQFLFDHGLPMRPDKRLRAVVKKQLLGRRRALQAAVRRAQPDLIHVHETHSDAGTVYRQLGRQVPILLTHHSPGIADACIDYDWVIFVSKRQRQAALTRWPKLVEHSSVIYYFAGPEYFRPHRSQPSENLVFVGNLDSERKGLGLLIEAWASRPELNRFCLHVIGEGRYRGRFEEAARSRGANLAFVGRLTAAEIAEIEAKSIAFVMPSRAEGLALAYIEALCMGLPILGFRPNVEELSDLLGISCGLAHDPDADPVEKLAERILRLASFRGEYSVERRAELQQRSRALFSQERCEGEYLELYEAILAGGGGSTE